MIRLNGGDNEDLVISTLHSTNLADFEKRRLGLFTHLQKFPGNVFKTIICFRRCRFSVTWAF